MATAPRAPSSRPLWTAYTLPAAAELDELGEAVLVEVPVSASSPDDEVVVAAEVVLTPEAPYVALTRIAPVPVAVAVALPMGK